MAIDPDPYRTLGLEPGASTADVKRAYRRLAKAFHPDSAGPAALPRFLAIQEAYERLTSGTPGRPMRGSTAGRGSRTGPTWAGGGSAGPEPWRADPNRARAAREQARARGRAGGAATGGGPTGGTGAGAGPRGGGPSSAGPGARGSDGGTGGGSGSASRAGGSGPGAGGAGAGTRSGGSGRRRASRKATMGSTSYDEARDPTDTTWGGASWYGPTSGEYWHVNPREYADPRKHGPEYQSRARRQASSGDGSDEGPSPTDEPASPARPSGSRPYEPPFRGTTSTGGARSDGDARSASGAARSTSSSDRTWSLPPEPADATARAGSRGARVPGDAERATRDAADPGFGGVEDAIAAAARGLAMEPRDPLRRLGFALLAWAPIGLAAAAIIGMLTGCSTYSASCTGAEPFLPWLAQAAIVGVILLVPPLARVLAAGTIAILLALLPLTGIAIALGGSAGPGGSAVAILLAIVWLVGVLLAVVGVERVRKRVVRT